MRATLLAPALALLCSSAVGVAASGGAAKASPILTTHGYGAIEFGAKLPLVEAKLHEKAPPPKDTDQPSCRYIAFKAYPGLEFMLENGVITRADVDEDGKRRVRTELGVSVGDAFGDVPAKFPTLQKSSNAYDAEEHDWVYPGADGRGALIVVEYRGAVREVHAGIDPSVYYSEGCS